MEVVDHANVSCCIGAVSFCGFELVLTFSHFADIGLQDGKHLADGICIGTIRVSIRLIGSRTGLVRYSVLLVRFGIESLVRPTCALD